MTNHARNVQLGKPVNSIADPYDDLLAQLDEGRRLGMIRRLSVGYYEGWAPSRAELSTLVDFELGRISEAEFFASRPTNVPARATSESAPTRTGNPPRPAIFNVDCGELAGRLHFIATRLRGAGWTVREDVNYRLVFLDYELLPVGSANRDALVGAHPVPFDGAIRCVPDVPAPSSISDGRSVRHVARPQGISGSRGPWPVADGVRLIKFVISRHPAAGSRSAGGPAGVLMIDLAHGRAAWKPVAVRRANQAAQN